MLAGYGASADRHDALGFGQAVVAGISVPDGFDRGLAAEDDEGSAVAEVSGRG